jgi:hypothetical protein
MLFLTDRLPWCTYLHFVLFSDTYQVRFLAVILVTFQAVSFSSPISGLFLTFGVAVYNFLYEKVITVHSHVVIRSYLRILETAFLWEFLGISLMYMCAYRRYIESEWIFFGIFFKKSMWSFQAVLQGDICRVYPACVSVHILTRDFRRYWQVYCTKFQWKFLGELLTLCKSFSKWNSDAFQGKKF